MKYKALMLDVDGTTVPVERDAVPTPRVIEAITQAEKFLKVGIATGRPLFDASPVLNALPLSAPCILNAGAQLYNPVEKKILWDKPLNTSEIHLLIALAAKHQAKLMVNDGKKDYFLIPDSSLPRILSGTIIDLEEEVANKILQDASNLSTIVLHKVHSWSKGKYNLDFSDVLSTKQHGIEAVAEQLGISTHEIIGVGDNHNDFPLLMACGLKVAIGNAVPELKEIADYVAPSVYEDGVADIIEKFILTGQSF
jgi:Cof subfamily protein (haloacid dehalogenase superfamily)